ncbi:MAG: S1 RNA-binding domain-containing protein [Rhodococcus sp. (in: high G+C Gram-positive bacteria)]|uniref:S1 RNA-binding domain-containing protein n=1 Tax=Rhodococcus sp. TaxID=1831 RepID=UPI002ADB05A4|nr:S1 RNA-binding domain-containing protein [Rhodococcus sp. (in: high G+C Gram-positive bacteria)]
MKGIEERIRALQAVVCARRPARLDLFELKLPSAGSRAYQQILDASVDDIILFLSLVQQVINGADEYILGIVKSATENASDQNRIWDCGRLLNFAGQVCLKGGREVQASEYFLDASIDARKSGDQTTFEAATLNRLMISGGRPPTDFSRAEGDSARDGARLISEFQMARLEYESLNPASIVNSLEIDPHLDLLAQIAQEIISRWGLSATPSVEVLTYLGGAERDNAVRSGSPERLSHALTVAETAYIFSRRLPNPLGVTALAALANFVGCEFEYARMIEQENLPYARRRLSDCFSQCSENLGPDHYLTIAAGVNYAVASLELSRKPLLSEGQMGLLAQAVEILEGLAKRAFRNIKESRELQATILNNLALAKVDVAMRLRSAESWDDARVASETAAGASSIVMGRTHPATKLLIRQANRCSALAGRESDHYGGGGIAVLTRQDLDFPIGMPDYVAPNEGWKSEGPVPAPKKPTSSSFSSSDGDEPSGASVAASGEKRTPRKFAVGDQVNARIVKVSVRPVMNIQVNVEESPGRMTSQEAHFLLSNNLRERIPHGELVRCVVVAINSENFLTVSAVSVSEFGWELAYEAIQSGRFINGTVVRTDSGGLYVHIGIVAFLPTSRTEFKETVELEMYLGRPVSVRVVDVDRGTNLIRVAWGEPPLKVLDIARNLAVSRGVEVERSIDQNGPTDEVYQATRVSEQTIEGNADDPSTRSSEGSVLEILEAVVTQNTSFGLYVRLESGPDAVILNEDMPKSLIVEQDLLPELGDILFCFVVSPVRGGRVRAVASAALSRDQVVEKFQAVYQLGSVVSGRLLFSLSDERGIFVRLPGGLLGFMGWGDSPEAKSLRANRVSTARVILLPKPDADSGMASYYLVLHTPRADTGA